MTLTDVEGRETAVADEARRQAAQLLDRMTLEEKVGQLHLMTVHRALDGARLGGSHFRPGALRDLLETASPVGGVLSGAGGVPVPNSPTSWREMVEELQEHAVRSSRLGIPLLYATDAIHGHNNVLGETVLPYAIGVGASWDPELAREVAAATAQAMRATGVPWNFAPDADLGRDPRWGRFCETYGEDTTLVAAMAAATVRGLQGEGPGVGTGSVAATVKHFVGYGSATNGLDRGDAEIPARVLRDRHLPAFRAAIDAGALAVMANSGSVNGVPVHMSRYLLTDVLRGELGFDGLVVSDWGDALFLERYYRTADTYADAVALSIGAGIDMVMAPFAVENLAETILMLLEQGRVSLDRVDEAALRVLTLKFRLGLFDDPVARPAPVAGASPTAAVALDAARRSIVLLRNSGSTLPLPPDARVCLVGPGASSVARLMGGLTIDWQGIGEDPAQWPPCTTIADGLRAVLGADRVLEPETADDRRRAMAACDAVVAVLGEHPYAEYAGDDRRLELPPDQVALAEEAQAAGVPLVVVLLAGRPVVLGPVVARADAILMAHLPDRKSVV